MSALLLCNMILLTFSFASCGAIKIWYLLCKSRYFGPMLVIEERSRAHPIMSWEKGHWRSRHSFMDSRVAQRYILSWWLWKDWGDTNIISNHTQGSMNVHIANCLSTKLTPPSTPLTCELLLSLYVFHFDTQKVMHFMLLLFGANSKTS